MEFWTSEGGILVAHVDGMITEVLIHPDEVASSVAFSMAAASYKNDIHMFWL